MVGSPCDDSDATISNNIITGNTGYLLGGGIWVQRGAPRIQYNRIQNNIAGCAGRLRARRRDRNGRCRAAVPCSATSSLAILSPAAEHRMAAESTSLRGGGPVLLANNTIVANAINGVRATSNITLVNNIIVTHPVGVSASATVNTSYNIYFGNTTNAQGFALSGTDLTVNPQLTANYHLNAGIACHRCGHAHERAESRHRPRAARDDRPLRHLQD